VFLATQGRTLIGTARVTSYEDLKQARAARAAKEAKKAEIEAKRAAKEAKRVTNDPPEAEGATAAKRRRSRKRKSLEGADAPEPKAKVARTDEAQVEGKGIAPESRRAPVARMW